MRRQIPVVAWFAVVGLVMAFGSPAFSATISYSGSIPVTETEEIWIGGVRPRKLDMTRKTSTRSIVRPLMPAGQLA